MVLTEMNNVETVMKSIPCNVIEAVHEDINIRRTGDQIYFNIK